ncbi:MAG: hypothetical protein O6947_07810, partial [Acidobacteria bacterium]|nr:hypothetical protein [Acidobacteriota bacterium]
MRFPGRSMILFGFLVVPATVSAEIIEEIVARVNDQVITKSELEEREGLMIQDFFQKFAGVELDEMLAEGRENLLRDLIAEKLLLDIRTAIVILIIPNILMDITQILRRGFPADVFRRFAWLLLLT